MGIQDHKSLTAAIGANLPNGVVQKSLMSYEWDVSGQCEAPHVFELFARPQLFGSAALRGLAPQDRRAFLNCGLVPATPVKGFSWQKGDNHPARLTLTVRCRRCAWCLRRRAYEWRTKAQLEIEAAPRTWFATYTLSPDEHFRVECEARSLAQKRSTVFEHNSEIEQFRLRCAAGGSDITRYVKRIRKQSGAQIRYLWVAERHQSGLPHYHALIHEVNADQPLRKAVLKEQWPHGFSRFKLVEGRGAAGYVCKYLSKDIAARVRSSIRYGKIGNPIYHHRTENSVREILTQTPRGRF